MVDFAAAGQAFQGYRAEPAGAARGAVIVIHEIWGLNAHTRDIADHFALEGYLAMAPDLMGLAGLDAVLLAELGERRADPAATAELQPLIRAATAPIDSPEMAARTRAGHAFFNDSNPLMYRAEPSRVAWQKTLDFLAQELSPK